MKTKKNEKTYAVSKDTVFFLIKLRRFMQSAWLNEKYPCYRDKEFTERMANLFDEIDIDKFDGVLIADWNYERQKITRILTRRLKWWPWLQWTIYCRGIFGWGARYKSNMYGHYQDLCRYFDGMFTEENKRDIMDIELVGPDEMDFHCVWFLLKKYAD